MKIFKVGGIWFVRLGRIRLSFCIARNPINIALTGASKLA